jgi:hypothetical protein
LRSRWDALRTTTTAAARVVSKYHPERIVIVIVRTAHPLRHLPPRLGRHDDNYPTVDSVSDGAVSTRRIHCVSDAGGSLVVIFVVVVVVVRSYSAAAAAAAFLRMLQLRTTQKCVICVQSIRTGTPRSCARILFQLERESDLHWLSVCRSFETFLSVPRPLAILLRRSFQSFFWSNPNITSVPSFSDRITIIYI